MRVDAVMDSTEYYFLKNSAALKRCQKINTHHVYTFM